LKLADLPHKERAEDTVDVLALDQAMARLETLDPQQAQVVELRYFGGLMIEETAAAMDISVATVNRYWRAARTWLFLKLSPQPES
jgi:RNA polymerase sigma factor (sigma-70 family)